MAAELLELGGNAARDNKHDKINSRHVTLAIRNDEELNKVAALLGNKNVGLEALRPRVVGGGALAGALDRYRQAQARGDASGVFFTEADAQAAMSKQHAMKCVVDPNS